MRQRAGDQNEGADAPTTGCPGIATASTVLACLLSLGVGGCSFLLDFDELKGDSQRTRRDAGEPGGNEPEAQSNSEPESDSDGQAEPTPEPETDETTSSEPEAQVVAPGEDGGTTPADDDSGVPPIPCGDGCDDGDPCTIDSCAGDVCVFDPMVCATSDSCVSSQCVNGVCVEEPITGLVADDYDQVVAGAAIYRAQLVAARDRFYSAAYGEFGGRKDIRLAAFDADGDGTIPAQSLASGLGANSEIVSPAAVVADTRLGLELNVYVAIRQLDATNAGELGNLIRVLFNADLELVTGSVPLLANASTYRTISERIGPVAGRPVGASADDDPYVVWFGELASGQRGLFVQSGDASLDVNSLGNAFFPEDSTVAGIAALDSGGNPGAVWLTNPASGGVAVTMATTASNDPVALARCQDGSGYSGYDLYATHTLNDLWTVAWSQQDGGKFVTENTILSCEGSSCVDESGAEITTGACTDEQLEARISEGVRSLVLQSFRRESEADVLYQAIAVVNGNSMGAVVTRVDYSNADGGAGDFTRIGSSSLAEATNATRPDWPSIAVVPPDKLAVSWIQPAADGDGDELHLQRHRICFGQ